MRPILTAALLSLVAGVAAAQPAPGTPPPPAPPGPARDDHRMVRGAEIRIQRDDISVLVRCAPGETTKACGEIVTQLLEKLPAAPAPTAAMPERRSDRGGERAGERSYSRDSDRYRGGGYRDGRDAD